MIAYVKYSIALHIVLLSVLVASAWWQPKPKVHKLKFTVLPRGNGQNAVLTHDVLKQLKLPEGQSKLTKPPPVKSENRTPRTIPVVPSPTPANTPVASKAPKQLEPTPKSTAKEVEVETRAQPESEPKATLAPALPSVTRSVDSIRPSPSLAKPDLKSQLTKSPDSTKAPSNSATQTNAPKQSPQTPLPPRERNSKDESKATPAKAPLKRPKAIASAYDVQAEEKKRRDGLARETPQDAPVHETAPPGKVAGIPGLPEGVEGAPLQLDSLQESISPLYTNRAILLLQRNFVVPPGVNDPDLVCIVEWEILPDGTVQNAKVVKSTGNAEYDLKAVEAVEKTKNLGKLPGEFTGKSLWVSLPFIFGS